MKILTQHITLPKLSGTDTIAESAFVFTGYIDSDFINWKLNVSGKKSPSLEVAICEMTEDADFSRIFPRPEEMCLSQAQIIEFCRNHQDEFRQDEYATFFLFKVDEDFFVARVGVYSGGRLGVHVFRFGYAYVWIAVYGRRVVIPQLVLKHLDSDPLKLSPSESLQKAIEEVKKAGFVIYKEI